MGIANSARFLFVSFLVTWVLSLGVEDVNGDVVPCKYPAIFNFGDSNSDTGSMSAAFYPRPAPNGVTFFHSPAGRVGDGRLIVDFIAKYFKLPYLSPYLDSFGTKFRHGANFATGGATIRRSNDSLFISGISPFPLEIQTVQYSNFKNRTTKLYSQAKRSSDIRKNYPRPEDFSKSLFIVDIGQNDLAAGFRTMMTNEKLLAEIPDMMNLFSLGIQFLYQQGARTFWIHNTGPIGCLPSTLFDIQNPAPGFLDGIGCIKYQNDMAKEFNRQLKRKVSELRAQLPLAALTYVDMYAAKYSLISNAKKLGFYENLNICCGSFKDGVRKYCGNNFLKNGTQFFVDPCKDPSMHISWDGIHYTEAANRWITNQIIKGSFSDPKFPISKACYRH
ncbi:GDSL esterase/lipase At5g14450-like [Humulus lupulus]|uniref:GDSL esterase/lipase At5g14450-like n=1 Tax=Humulus lupulus TaxID=3486 RepID=UPI002B4061EE|nr:GDSL esterase/lipase At5g14450-like [Humulus lupulus]